MTRLRPRIHLAFVLLLAATPVRAQTPSAEPPRIRGAGDCLSCHTLRTGNYKSDFVLLNEFATWRLSDPHSLAYVALESKRGRQISRLLGFDDVTRPEAGCLGCHAPQATEPTLRKENAEVLRKEGVGCESCHGASEHWFGNHFDGAWRTAPKEKLKKQMYDVRDPVKKSELCVSCHVGDATRGRVVTHAMYAAGHPPLPSVEVASFAEQMPYHWRHPGEVPLFKTWAGSAKPEERKLAEQEYGLTSPPSSQARLVAASGLAVLSGELDLVAGRCQFDAKDAATRWPEKALPGFRDIAELPALWPQIAMAHSDCASCHHELAHASWRQVRGYPGRPGRVPLAEWPFTLTSRGVGLGAGDREALTKSFQKVFEACSQRPFGDPAALGMSARMAGAEVRKRFPLSEQADAKSLLQSLSTMPAEEYLNFDSARQILAALRSVEGEAGAGDTLRKALDPWAEKLDLETPEKKAVRRAQQKLVISLLQKVGSEPGAPRPTFPTDPAFLDAFDVYSRTGSFPQDAGRADALRRLLHALTENGGTPMTLEVAKDAPARQELEAANEARLRASLRRARDYDPREFRAFLKKLPALLPSR